MIAVRRLALGSILLALSMAIVAYEAEASATSPSRPTTTTKSTRRGSSREELAIQPSGPVSITPRGTPRPLGGDAAREAYRRYNYGYFIYPSPYFVASPWIGWGYGGWW